MGSTETSIEAVDAVRRASILRAIAIAFVPLSAASAIHTTVVGAPPVISLSLWGSALGFAIAVIIGRPPGRPAWAAAIFFATMLSQHVATSLPNPDAVGAAATIYFTGLVPLIAAFTGGRRAVVLASTCAVLTTLICTAGAARWGHSGESLGRALGPPIVFVIITVVLGNLIAWASARSLTAQIAADAERGRLQNAARGAEARFAAIADHVSDLVAMFDPEGRNTFSSASFERTLGVVPAQLIATNAAEPFVAADLPNVQQAFLTALREGKAEVVAGLEDSAGTVRSFHLRFARLAAEAGPAVAMAGRDITEVQRLAGELDAARRMEALGRLAGGVAHDFNNLLSIVSSATYFAQQQIGVEHPAHTDLALVNEAVTRAASLTKQLLTFARSQLVPRADACPALVIQAFSPLLKKAAGSTELKIEIEGAELSTAATSTQIEQIVLNLVVNARDAGAAHVLVRAADVTLGEENASRLPAGAYALIEVRDDGPGLDEAVNARLFEPFFTTKSPGRGTGLGLATCFGIATLHGGTILADSALGVGTTFRVWLPRAAPDAAASAVATPPGRPRTTSRRRVLAIEDDPEFGALVRRMLDAAGYDATLATNSADATRAARSQGPFDVVLTDVVLGKEDGIALLVQIVALLPTARLIVMSGFAPQPERLASLGMRIAAVLAKPFTADALQQALGND